MSLARIHIEQRLNLENLEDRLTPSATAPDVDLTTRGSIGEVGGAIFRQIDAQPTGTGVINSFVRLQAQGAKTTAQQGFNTDGVLQFDENKSRQFTHSLKLGDVPEVDIGGVKYREFLLDINQKSSQPYLSLDEVRVFVNSDANLSGYNPTTHQLAGLTAAFDMDAGGDHWVKLDSRLNSGSGKGDMLMYVPSQVLGNDANANVYLFSRFGDNFTANAGFEEWAVGNSSLTNNTSSISGTVRDVNGNPMADVVVWLDTNNDGVLDGNEVYTTTDANGAYTFTNLASGLGSLSTYTVRQVVPDGWVQVGDSPQSVTFDQPINYLILIDFVNQTSYSGPPNQ